MELHEKNMMEMEISDKYSLVGWYVHRNDCENLPFDSLYLVI